MTKLIQIIEPPKRSAGLQLKELWEYRELAWTMMLRDIKVRYKQTVLGLLWAIIQPLTTMVIFSFIFGRLAQIPSDGVPYPVFVFSGMLAWNLFSSAVSSGGMSMVGAAGMISKVYFPRLIVPLSSIGVSAIDFLISFGILLILMLVYSIGISWQIVLFPFFVFGLLLSAIGLSTWLTAITVVYRDFRFVLPFMIQIWMYVTPVIYPLSFIPSKWQWLLYLNPVAGWVGGIRATILGTPIQWNSVCVSLIFSVVLLIVGLRYFEKAEKRFADVI